MIPKDEIYVPPMNINILDHRHFGGKPIVGVHVIKSLQKFRVDRQKDSRVFSHIEAIQNQEDISIPINDESDYEVISFRIVFLFFYLIIQFT